MRSAFLLFLCMTISAGAVVDTMNGVPITTASTFDGETGIGSAIGVNVKSSAVSWNRVLWDTSRLNYMFWHNNDASVNPQPDIAINSNSPAFLNGAPATATWTTNFYGEQAHYSFDTGDSTVTTNSATNFFWWGSTNNYWHSYAIAGGVEYVDGVAEAFKESLFIEWGNGVVTQGMGSSMEMDRFTGLSSDTSAAISNRHVYTFCGITNEPGSLGKYMGTRWISLNYNGLYQSLVGFYPMDDNQQLPRDYSTSDNRVTQNPGGAAATQGGTVNTGWKVFNGSASALEFDSTSGLISEQATATQGTWFGWCYAASDTGNDDIIVSTGTTGGTATLLGLRIDWNTEDGFRLDCFKDNTAQWTARTANNSADPYVTNWFHYAMVNDGVNATRLYIDGVDQALTYSVTTDTNAWAKAVFTDASAKSDIITLGAINLSGLSNYLNGRLDEIGFSTTAFTSNQVFNLATETNSAALHTPNLQ